MHEVAIRLQAVGLGGFDQGIKIGAGFGPVHGVSKNPVFAPDDEGADSVFGEVVVKRLAAIVDEADELRPLVIHIVT